MSDNVPFANFMLWDYAEVIPRLWKERESKLVELVQLTAEHRGELYSPEKLKRLDHLIDVVDSLGDTLKSYSERLREEREKLT